MCFLFLGLSGGLAYQGRAPGGPDCTTLLIDLDFSAFVVPCQDDGPWLCLGTPGGSEERGSDCGIWSLDSGLWAVLDSGHLLGSRCSRSGLHCNIIQRRGAISFSPVRRASDVTGLGQEVCPNRWGYESGGSIDQEVQ